ncbi:MAG: hypothetical protein AAF512_22760, partial [Pseudomonadota bacterium]
AIEQQKTELQKDKLEKLVRPRMKETYMYLREMAHQLNTIKPDTRVSYHIKGHGDIDNLLQSDYLAGNYNEKEDRFFFRFICKSERPIRFERFTNREMEEQKDFLWKHNVPFKYAQVNDKKERFMKAVFDLGGEIIGEFNFVADVEHAVIDVFERNFNGLGKVHYRIQPEILDEKFLDDLAMYITRAGDKDFLRPFAIDQIWTTHDATPTQKMREEILAEMRKKEALGDQEEDARKQILAEQERLKKKLGAKKRTADEPKKPAKKKGLFGGLFGKD